MIRYTLFIIFSVIILSSTSPVSSGRLKFYDRVGTYKNSDKTITVVINNKDADNLSININSPSINDVLTVNKSTTATYLTIKSVNQPEYTYNLNLGNYVNSIFIFVKKCKESVVFNEKLTIQK